MFYTLGLVTMILYTPLGKGLRIQLGVFSSSDLYLAEQEDKKNLPAIESVLAEARAQL